MHNIILLDAPEYPSWPVVGERHASYLSGHYTARWITRSCITEAIAEAASDASIKSKTFEFTICKSRTVFE